MAGGSASYTLSYGDQPMGQRLSDPEAVFLLFDAFDGTGVHAARWQEEVNATVSGGVLRLGASGGLLAAVGAG
ncbi:MAG: hypothetical protein JRH20_32765, partial [Deltaproteobacteria bacterium]|nr:hypothetical protein [Deltaproteobacteria bacterium]